MHHGWVSEIMPASAADVFALLHDYPRRLQWDTLLSAAYLSDGHDRTALGATSVCIGRGLLGRIALKTVYVAFDPPRLAAVKMINAPPLFASWAASIKHEDLGPASSRVTYLWSFETKPRWLAWLFEPLMGSIFRSETRKRLHALERYLMRSRLEAPVG